ncbi:MAG TPA: hypothetical protein VGJ83_06340 [Gemmatimonadales bacterium]
MDTRVERRVRPERRSGLDRRSAERRVRIVAVLVQQRYFASRRGPMERRAQITRRRLSPS